MKRMRTPVLCYTSGSSQLLMTVPLKSLSFLYEEMESEFPISVKTKNLFLSLAESIAQTLNVTSCYVCGGTNIGDQ
jgi:hypothetical protein